MAQTRIEIELNDTSMRRLAVVAVFSLSATLAAQQAAPAFEAASIKRSAPGAEYGGWSSQPGGRWAMRNGPVSVLIRQAYPTEARELINAPGWVTDESYDVNAVAAGNPGIEQIRPMLRTLLAERFKLAVHYEAREQPVYALRIARNDKRTPPALKRSTLDCEAVTAARREGQIAEIPDTVNGVPPCTFNRSSGPGGTILKFAGLPLSWFGQSVGQPDGRVVVDRTGLTGGYEFTLVYDPEPIPGGDNPSLFTALQEQLGLRLVRERAALQTLVIDHIERPASD